MNNEQKSKNIKLLGLPLKPDKTDMVEIWADPKDLFRPSPDPDITDHKAALDFPRSNNFLTVTDNHRRWFNKNRDRSYVIDDHPYPWTRMGYTYDWGNPVNELGLNEFVIKKGAPIEIHSVLNVDIYCN